MPGHKRTPGKMITILGFEGKKVDILPTTRGLNFTELHCKTELIGESYMGVIAYDKKWKKYVLVDMDEKFQMSRDCINEAFDMTEKYWEGNCSSVIPGGKS